MPDKILVSNGAALGAKYGGGKAAIDNAIQALIAADAQRGLATLYVPIDDPVAMANAGGIPVAQPADQPAVKAAIDAVYQRYVPDYLVVVGGPDIIPHQDLTNPVYSPPDDPDLAVPSDLPYACTAGYSQDPGSFVGPIRVVSRIPDLTGRGDVAYLVALLSNAAGAAPGNAQGYGSYLGVTAQVWAGSTQLSLASIFGNASALQQVPPAGYGWTPAQLQCMSHFFNCHGAPNNHRFYGQLGSSYPPAHDAAYLAGKLHSGAILAAECCYGAQLYDPAMDGGQMGIANAYMQQGAYGYFGSTTIAYGPATSNANADLICQYFLQEVLRGASVGRACLASRQRFVQSSSVLSPTDLKTLAQFILLADASIQCIAPQSPAMEAEAKYALLGAAAVPAGARARKERRLLAAETGLYLQRAKRFTRRRPETAADTGFRDQLAAIAQRAGYTRPKTLTFDVTALDESYTAEAKSLAAAPSVSAVHVLMETLDSAAPRGVSTRLLEVQEASGSIVGVRELFSR